MNHNSFIAWLYIMIGGAILTAPAGKLKRLGLVLFIILGSIGAFNTLDDFYGKITRSSEVVQAGSSEVTQVERMVWQAALKTHTIESLENYKKQYPHGHFVTQADAALHQLWDKKHNKQSDWLKEILNRAS